jgi:hypothetical protein
MTAGRDPALAVGIPGVSDRTVVGALALPLVMTALPSTLRR